MKSTYVVDSDYAGQRLLGARGRLAVESWDILRPFIEQALGPDEAALLAEPEPSGGNRYAWFANQTGNVRALSELSPDERSGLLEKARTRLDGLVGLAADQRISNDPQRRFLGELLQAAISLPTERLERSLYAVGGEPVIVDWGCRPDVAGVEPTVPEIPVFRPRSNEPQAYWALLRMDLLLWLLFIAVAATIFVRLLDGCGLMARIGLAQPYCSVGGAQSTKQMLALQTEMTSLDAQLKAARRAILEAPRCDGSVPVAPGHQVIPQVRPPSPVSDPDSGAPNASLNASRVQAELNDLVRSAGGGLCPGIEVIAHWSERVDLDLRLYCLAPEANGSQASAVGIVDPFQTEACNASMDIVSTEDSDSGSDGKSLERICIIPDESTPLNYLATVYNHAQSADVPVTLVARGAGVFEQREFVAPAKRESEDLLAIQVQ